MRAFLRAIESTIFGAESGRLGIATIMMTAASMLAACMYTPLPACLTLSPFEEAASYDWMLNERHYSEPLNAWIRNERLQRFLQKSYRSGGIGALKSQYGFECDNQPVVPNCADCHVCSASLPKQVAQQEEIPTGHLCSKSGEMLIQVNIGPGQNALDVLTYWKRPPLR